MHVEISDYTHIVRLKGNAIFSGAKYRNLHGCGRSIWVGRDVLLCEVSFATKHENRTNYRRIDTNFEVISYTVGE